MTRKIASIVEKIIAHDRGVYTVSLKPLSACPKYRPGQFLHLTLDDYDPAGGFWPESRVFSISSRYGQETLRILYSVKGSYTSRMEKELVVGRQCWIKLPYGEFIIDAGADEHVILLAGGTGISPFIPFLESLSERRSPKVTVLYGARSKRLLVLKNFLDDLIRGNGMVDCKMYIEEGPIETGLTVGRIPVSDIISAATNLDMTKIFISGPPAMISYFVSEIPRHGIGSEKIFVDAWE